ncbi:MAG: tRNA-binding protein [Candidatus Marsarchaeota archaeon]|jgi:methionine--tRNA ligase beta chain|nr:tRNA-binding protein [Candidatus Marsarchaeota archaeon]MCL5115142.1 tRNA-binding protein [Candidatus Marsarchaeota archaeon]
MVNISEFSLLDIRVGKIVDVVDINSRKPMYGLKVDLGGLGIKNIAAGIKEAYSKEGLMGKRVIVLANLEPKSIAGFVSEGMLLAAVDENSVSLLETDRDVQIGSKVS